MQARASEDLLRLICDGLKGAGLTWGTARAFATPRRLALVVDGLPVSTPDRTEEVKGPRVGAPDQAIQGFLRKPHARSRRNTLWFSLALQLPVAIYGAFFGAGIGILMLASFGFMGMTHIHEMNALKNYTIHGGGSQSA
jgi:hypothetical protein